MTVRILFNALEVDFNAEVTRRVEELGPANGKRRIVTLPIVDRVFEQLVPAIALED
jgi:hypothetical protein